MARKRSDRKSRREFLKKTAKLGAAAATIGALPSLIRAARADAAADVEVDETIYHYIVIGSGAGGGTVASRLVQQGHRVLLLEAGQPHPFSYDAKADPALLPGLRAAVPGAHPFATEDPTLAWAFYVRHYNDLARDAANSKFVKDKGGILYPRGATLGGSTAINAMISLYPDDDDWNEMGRLIGDEKWNASSMWEYFQRVDKTQFGSTNHLAWLTSERTPLRFALKDPKLAHLAEAAILAGKIAGDPAFAHTRVQSEILNVLEDLGKGAHLESVLKKLDGLIHVTFVNSREYVGNKFEGFAFLPKATEGGRRVGVQKLIMDTWDSNRDKFFLRTGALVTKLQLDGNKRVRGVEYVMTGQKGYEASPGFQPPVNPRVYRARVTNEVILSGGAFNTPQILMLSGIGPKAGKVAPQVVLEGVGKNLQDRYEIGVTTEMNSDFNALKGCATESRDFTTADRCVQDWLKHPSRSPFSSNGVVAGIFRRSQSFQGSKHIDLCVFPLLGRFPGYYPGWSKDTLKKDVVTWAVLKGHTENQAGTVTLKSASPFDAPEINFRYFQDGSGLFQKDLDAVREGIEVIMRANQWSGIRRFIANDQAVVATKDTGLKDGAGLPFSLGDDNLPDNAVLEDFIQREAWGHHASCTAKMGNNDPMAVVDSNFRVHGVTGLRIVDASIFPKLPGLFLAVPTYVIAERAAEVIHLDHADTYRAV